MSYHAVPRFRLAESDFIALAKGGGDPSAIDDLIRGEVSWRMIALRAVVDGTRDRVDAVGPLDTVTRAWQLLVSAEHADPSTVRHLIAHPTTGAWLGHVLRRLRGRSVAQMVPAPLWLDVGYLHALAAVAAIRAGLDFDLRVPVRAGNAMLPTLGDAAVGGPEPWTSALVRARAGRAEVAGSAGTVAVGTGVKWRSLHLMQAQAGGVELRLVLDDLDPYRELTRTAPARRLGSAESAQWQDLLAQAWEVLVRTEPGLARTIAAGLTSLTPQPPMEPYRPLSASAGDAFGTAIASTPDDPIQFAVTLVHEFQHVKLGGLLRLFDLYDRGPRALLYAPWRDDPRPTGGVLQGVYAFLGITGFWRALRHETTGATAELAHFEFALWRHGSWRALDQLCALPVFTAIGRQLLDHIRGTMRPWRAEPVPRTPLRAARAAADAHTAAWRLYHTTPDAAAVARLAKDWRARRAPSTWALRTASALTPDAEARSLDTTAVLFRWRWSNPDGFAELCQDPTAVAARVRGAVPADLRLVAGDPDDAAAGYLRAIAADPNQTHEWAGLAASRRWLDDDTGALALSEHAELVRAVYLACGAETSPVALAGWLGRAAPRRSEGAPAAAALPEPGSRGSG